MAQITWKRPSGTTLITGDAQAIIDQALANGWEAVEIDGEPIHAVEEEEPKPKRRRKKAEPEGE